MDAIHNADYPVLFVIVMLAATVSIIGNLIADILYAWADPRVRFSK
jgi:peptide/nickel transport system permease protein